ncbi:MAG: hypothetical protein N2Z65_01315 [Clostridiales bacterium]|nr:hypothetical protein [Clostridiales bacterium]
MPNSLLTPHEQLYLHELLSFKNTCALKSSIIQAIVTDHQLKDLFNKDMALTKRQLQELQGILSAQN